MISSSDFESGVPSSIPVQTTGHCGVSLAKTHLPSLVLLDGDSKRRSRVSVLSTGGGFLRKKESRDIS